MRQVVTKVRLYMLLLAVVAQAAAGSLRAATVAVSSPDKQLVLTVQTGNAVSYTVQFKGSTVVALSAIDLVVGGKSLSANARVQHTMPRTVNQVLTPLYGKFARWQGKARWIASWRRSRQHGSGGTMRSCPTTRRHRG
jgi:hypothetical protein